MSNSVIFILAFATLFIEITYSQEFDVVNNVTLPFGMHYFCAFVTENAINVFTSGIDEYTVGNFTQSKLYTLYSSNIQTKVNKWEITSPRNKQQLNLNSIYDSWEPSYFSTSCHYDSNDGLLYLLPSFYKEYQLLSYSQLFIYNPNINQYQISSTSYIELYASCTILHNATIYAIGGINSGFPTSNTMSYNISMDSWTTLSDFPLTSPRGMAGCTTGIYQNNLYFYIIGGWVASGFSSNSIETWNPQIPSGQLLAGWQLINARLITGRQQHQCINFSKYIYCIGGITASLEALKSVEVFNPNTNEIISTAEINMNYARNFATRVVFDIYGYDHLIVMGGLESDISTNYGSYDSMEILYHTSSPTIAPSLSPTISPSCAPTFAPTISPTTEPTMNTGTPTFAPTEAPTDLPTDAPTIAPSQSPTEIEYVYIAQNANIELTFLNFIYISSALFGVIVVILFCGYYHNKCYTNDGYEFEGFALFKFILFALDFVSDLFFSVNLYYYYQSDVKYNDVFLGLFIASIVFILLPTFLSLYEMEKFITRYIKEYDDELMNQYFANYSYLLYSTAFMIGNVDATISLFSCNLFNLNVFMMDINIKERILIKNRYSIHSIIFENLPQLIISIIYTIYNEQIFANHVNDIVIFTFIFGITSIIISLVTYSTRKKLLKYSTTIQQTSLEINSYQIMQDD